MPIDGNVLVNTSWDLGAPANTVVWYWQAIGREIRIVDCDQGFEGTLVQRVAAMNAKGFAFGKHFVPHDALQTSRSGSTFLSELSPLLPGVVTVPRCHTEWIGINHLLQMFNTLAFRSTPEVLTALDTLACYHTRKSGLQAGELVHDWSSHTADALRTMAEAHRADLFKFKHTTAQPRPDWHDPDGKQNRKGIKARTVSGLRV
jgi:phage terminase large subunit